MSIGGVTEGQTTHHDTDVMAYFALVAMGDANITNELPKS
jgi:hypothetical protein